MGKSLAWGPAPVLVMLLLVGACSNSSEPADTTFVVAVEVPTTAAPNSTTATSISTTTSAVAATTAPTTTADAEGPLLPDPIDDAAALTDPDAPAPPVDLQADTWSELVGVWAEIDAYWTWLNAHPTEDPDVLAVIFHPDGPEFDEQIKVNRNVVAQGLRVISESTLGEIIGFGCCPDPDRELATGKVRVLVITRAPTPFAVVTLDDGTVTEEIPGWDRAEFSLEFRRTANDGWKLWAQT